jgi:stage II sporulation protein E
LNGELYNDKINLIVLELMKHSIMARNVHTAYFFDGRLQIKLQLCALGKGCITTTQAARIISGVAGIKLEVSDNNRIVLNGNWNDYLFVEKCRFEAVWGVAKKCYNDNTISGDSYLVHRLKDGRVVFGLADGMGCGTDAGRNSMMVLECLENSLTKGFSEQMAIESANMLMTKAGQVPSTVAVDLCVIDLFLGIAEFTKLGAAAAYIKRGSIIEVILSETLPIGVLDYVDFDSTRKKLYGGDYIIMVSDGVLEMMSGVNKEKAFAALLLKVKALNPTAMAQEIIDIVTDRRVICDDLTVMVIGIYE